MKTPLEQRRLAYIPQIPRSLEQLDKVIFKGEEATAAIDHVDELKARFPHTFGQPVVTATEGEVDKRPLRIGVVLSGGQAARGRCYRAVRYRLYTPYQIQTRLPHVHF